MQIKGTLVTQPPIALARLTSGIIVQYNTGSKIAIAVESMASRAQAIIAQRVMEIKMTIDGVIVSVGSTK